MMNGQAGRESLYQQQGAAYSEAASGYYAAYSSDPPPANNYLGEYQLPEGFPQRHRAGGFLPDPAAIGGAAYPRDSGVYLGGPSPGYNSELDLSGRYRSYKDSSGDQGIILNFTA